MCLGSPNRYWFLIVTSSLGAQTNTWAETNTWTEK